MIDTQSRCSALSERKSTYVATLFLMALQISSCATQPWYDTPPVMPVPVSPEVAAVLGPAAMVTFTWEATTRTETYDIHIFNAVNSDIDRHMQRGLRPSQVCQDGICRVTLSLSLPASDRHAWRVRSVNVAGFSAWTRNLFTWVDQ